MSPDLEVIIRQYPREWDALRVYAIGDVHVGAENFNPSAVRKKLQIVADDPCAALVLCGDLGDYGLKTSKTNTYQATMQPKEQQEYIYKLFLPVVDKLAAAVPGNHEERMTKEVGLCPLYDLCVRWGVPEVYRDNVAVTKYIFGTRNGGQQQNVFIGLTSHGSSRNKHKKFIAGFDGIDFAISGHTHTPEYSPHGKIRIDRVNAKASHIPYKEIVVDANLAPGGYSLKKEYEIAPPPELQYLELSSYREADYNRTEHRVIDYHAITI